MDFVWTIFLSKNEPFISACTQICIIKKENKIKFGSKLPNNKVSFFKQKSCHKIIPNFFVNFQTTKAFHKKEISIFVVVF
jgi:hypothetical protein